MVYKKKILNSLEQSVSFYGSELITIISIFINTLASNDTIITNNSKHLNIINLINILKILEINIGISKDNIININASSLSAFKEPENLLSIKTSQETLYILVAILSNLNFKTFIASKKINNLDLSNLFNLLNNKITIIARNNKNLPLLIEGNNKLNLENFETDNHLLKFAFLFLYLASKKKNETILKDKNIKYDYIEKLLSLYGFDIREKYFESTSFFSKEIQKRKEIFLPVFDKYNAKNLFIPSDIKDIIYYIFLSIIYKDLNININCVAINEYNDRIIKILIDSKANLELFNYKITNSFKTSNISIKNSKLYKILITEQALINIIDYYPILIFIAIINGCDIEIHGTQELVEKDNSNFEIMLEILNKLQVDFTLNRNIFKINYDENFKMSNINLTHTYLNKKILLPILIINNFIDNYFELTNVNLVNNEEEFNFFKDFCSYLDIKK